MCLNESSQMDLLVCQYASQPPIRPQEQNYFVFIEFHFATFRDKATIFVSCPFNDYFNFLPISGLQSSAILKPMMRPAKDFWDYHPTDAFKTFLASSVVAQVNSEQKIDNQSIYLRWNEPRLVKPRLNFRLVVHKLNAQGLPSLFFGKAKSRLNLGGRSLH